jgi:hypothetical protein
LVAGRQQCDCRHIGRGNGTPGGAFARGAHSSDGQVNWETQTIPRKVRRSGAPVTRLRPEREIGCSRIGDNKSIRQVGQKQGRPELRPMVVRESEGLIRAEKLGNGWHRNQRSKGGPCWYELCEGNMSEPKTSTNMSTALAKYLFSGKLDFLYQRILMST